MIKTKVTINRILKY